MSETKLLVLSDTHRRVAGLSELLLREQPDLIVHLGDNTEEGEYLSRIAKVPVEAVKGNCDYASPLEETRLIYKHGRRLLLTHGHRFGVKYSLTRLALSAEEKQVDAVLFGHTHRALLEYERGILLFNPGSYKDGSFGIVTVSDMGVTGRLCGRE